MRRWWKHTTEKTYEEMWSWELREELCGRDATITAQAATIERFREFVSLEKQLEQLSDHPPDELDTSEKLYQAILKIRLLRREALNAITAADMGEAE